MPYGAFYGPYSNCVFIIVLPETARLAVLFYISTSSV